MLKTPKNVKKAFNLVFFLDLWHKRLLCAGFEDYGAYWRYNYETLEDDIMYHYTGDELMEDVRVIYKQVRPCLCDACFTLQCLCVKDS